MKEYLTGNIQISTDTKLQVSGRHFGGEKIYFLRSIYLYLCLAGTYLTVREAFGLKGNGNFILLILGLDCLALSLIWWKWGKICWYGWNTLVFITGAILWKKVIAGYIAVENGGRKQLSNYYQMNLAQRKIPIEGENGELFLILVFTLLICLMGRIVVQKGRVSLLALFQILFFLLELVCGNNFQGPGIYLMAAGVLALLAMGSRKGGKHQEVVFSVGVWAGGVLLILSLVCGLFLGPVVYRHASEANKTLYDKVQQVTREVSSAMQSQNGIFGDHTPTADGSLNNYPVEQSQETDLEITVSQKPERSMYLKGFVGDTYEGSYWHRIEEDEFRDKFPGKDAPYQIQNILFRYLQKRENKDTDTVQIKRLQPGGEYGYIPYGFQVPEDENLVGDSYYSSAEDELEYSGYINWESIVGNGPAQEPESEIEAAYQEYVAQQYLKIPVEGLERLREYCSQYQFSSVQEVIDFVVPTVKEGRPYSMDLEPVPHGKDFAEYFFFDQKKGYCIHYATTATLMLRILGVPARYVTGYMVSPDAFVESEGGFTAKVPDSQAHAWVEVYRTGKGWIPLEVTPGYEVSVYNEQGGGETPVTATPEPEVTTPEPSPVQEETSPIPAPEEEQSFSEETEEEQTNQEKPSEDAGISDRMRVIGIIFLWMLGIILAVFLLLTGIFMNRKRILAGRERRFMQKDCRKGICEISYGLYQMLQDGEISRDEAMEDMEFARQMEDKLEILQPGEYEKFVRIVQQAAFGNEKMEEEQRIFCRKFYGKIASYLWNRMSGGKKIWWKYMKCYEMT